MVPVVLKLNPGFAGWLPNNPPEVAPVAKPVPKVEPVPRPVVPVPKPPGLLAPNKPPPAVGRKYEVGIHQTTIDSSVKFFFFLDLITACLEQNQCLLLY